MASSNRNTNPRMAGASHQRAATPEIGERVQSARRLRINTFQNQLADAQLTIADLSHENRLLRTVHKRQEAALSKHVSTSAELPRLLHSHSEELRVWQAKFHSHQAINKELNQKLKQRDAVILSLSDQNKYYNQLNKEKSLGQRHRLNDELNRIQKKIDEKDKFELKQLERKSQIEINSLQKQIETEQRKSKEACMGLDKNRLKLSELRKIDEMSLNEQFASMGFRRKVGEPQLGKQLGLPTAESDCSSNNPVDEPMDSMVKNRTRKMGTSKMGFPQRTVKEVGDPTPRTASTTVRSARTITPQKQRQLRKDRGDGDAAVLNEIKNDSNKNKLPPEEPQPSIQGEYNHDHGDASDLDDAETTDALMVANGTDENIGMEMKLIDDEEGNNSDDVDEYQNKMPVLSKLNSPRIKKEISNIRKHLSAEFKEREDFLDSFCMQATNNNLSEAPPNRIIVDRTRVVPRNRNNELLATLRSMDDKKSVEQNNLKISGDKRN